ncbi:MAG: TetR/AcrR family transcriptional regulator [Luteimonas sp.]|nr:TetR/AcrR family transcriptional regulator [Luteimonas sp.]
MSAITTPAPAAGPGRPKDPNKRAAILEAARRMFTLHSFDGASMDQIATEAGVSKLTVYSHFGDKSALFATVVRTYCEQSLPDALFDPAPGVPLRERLLDIARAFFSMVSSREAVAGHRVMCAPKVQDSPLPTLFWEAGPMRIQAAFAQLLERRIAAGELEIPDVARAASQFFVLLKGEVHARLVLGQCNAFSPRCIEEHLEATVDMFLRAYASGGRPRTATPA